MSSRSTGLPASSPPRLLASSPPRLPASICLVLDTQGMSCSALSALIVNVPPPSAFGSVPAGVLAALTPLIRKLGYNTAVPTGGGPRAEDTGKPRRQRTRRLLDGFSFGVWFFTVIFI
ncbi:hypothetical protein EYF80_058975 [Liparis tanakae]|uniref:Uncharacterized protein n=1 Tax=Liparis tanakae TaxID=230148 RepID=A0A4Z2ERF0_9TELE|nr:hypothetical protein EYF80_058975 [Liparis tanakae]